MKDAADPIRKTLTIPLTPDTAFDLFVNRMDSWWPKETHSLAAGKKQGDKARIRVEPRVGGRVMETDPDGSEAAWATITAWQPGAHFAMRWYVGRDPSEATLVDIRFAAVDTGTRVDLTHSGFDILGTDAERLCANYTQGWDMVLGTCFGGACRKVAA